MIRRLAAALALLAAFAGTAIAADNRPGRFDFYVLSLSWSPSFCASRAAKPGDPQCAGTRPYAFVVHGLWPQNERGYPRSCGGHGEGPDAALVASMLDIMPSPGLVTHEWQAHGTCDGDGAATYFERTRKARERITIPAEFRELDRYRSVTPDAVEKAFTAANPGLGADMISVTCRGRDLQEVRICVDRDGFGFRACPGVDADRCTRAKVVMPPSRAARP